MHLHLSAEAKVSERRALRFRCGQCGQPNVEGFAEDREQRFRILFVIPAGVSRETVVTCPNCRSEFVADEPTAVLARTIPNEVERMLRPRVSIVADTLLWGGVLFLVVPIFGLIFSAGALAMLWKSGGWKKKLAAACVLFGALWSAFALLGGLLAKS